jgi:pyruvate formate lyase activating enzyme
LPPLLTRLGGFAAIAHPGSAALPPLHTRRRRVPLSQLQNRKYMNNGQTAALQYDRPGFTAQLEVVPPPLPERKALIFNVQKYNMHDGPGVRTLIFFKGCPLRCKWCSNPEGLLGGHQIIFKRSACVDCLACAPVCPVGIHEQGAEGLHLVNRTRQCVGCGACESVCPVSALSVAGGWKSISELMEIIQEDRSFYEFSGGGVTLGGGEVTMQPDAALSLLMTCRQQGIHTAIESCGYVKLEVMLRFAEYTDLFLFDVKLMDPEEHFKYTGVRNERILENLNELLRRRCHVQVRIPLLHGVNDDFAGVEKLCDLLSPYAEQKHFKGVQLLPYHKLGTGKYEQLGMEYLLEDDPAPSEDDLARVEKQIAGRGIEVSIIRH